MKNINKILYLSLLLSLLLMECKKDVLNLKNPNVLTQETFWKNEADVQTAMASVYKTFTYPFSSGYFNVRGIELTNGRGDDFVMRINDIPNVYRAATFTNDPNNGDVSNLFQTCYTAIFRANQVIENVPGISGISKDAKNEYIAEAKFLRGLNYFFLTINFGDVPLRTFVPKARNDFFIPSSPAAKVWNLIISDFKAAKDSLPLSYEAQWTGRATKGAAIGFLGKAYLYTAKYAEAEAEFNVLMQAPFTYDLIANYENNFRPEPANENNAESLFEIQFANVGGLNFWENTGSSQGQGTVSAQECAPGEISGWFEWYPTDKLLNEFLKEKTITNDFDPRMYATLVWDYPGALYYQKAFSTFVPPYAEYHSRWRKYQNWWATSESDANAGLAFGVSSINERVLRFADILLMQAEALTMQEKVAEAYVPMKRIRDRAKLAALPAGYTHDQMMAEIRHQRMIEFAREGQRFYDLRRWGLLEQEIANSDKDGKQNFSFAKYSYFPIPQTEIDSNDSIQQSLPWR